MKNKLKVFFLIAGVIAMCSALVCFIFHTNEEDDDPIFI